MYLEPIEFCSRILTNLEVKEDRWPFKVNPDSRIDWDTLTVRVQFSRPFPIDDLGILEDTIQEWARGEAKGRGINPDWALDEVFDPDEVNAQPKGVSPEQEDALGREFLWGPEGRWIEFGPNVGVDDKTAAPSFNKLFTKLTKFGMIKEVKIGSGYEW